MVAHAVTTAPRPTVLRKAPKAFTTPLGDQVVVRQRFDLVHLRFEEHIEISHPRELELVAFSRGSRQRGPRPC